MRIFTFIFVLLPTLAIAAPLRISSGTNPSSTYRWLDGKTRNLGGLIYDGKDIVVARNVIRFWDEKDSHTVVRNSTFSLKQPTTNPGDLPVALEYVGGHDHLIENVIAENFRSVPREGEYENGDCFSGEPKARRITFRNTIARNCSDGGYDFKSLDVRFENATAEDVSKGWRIWGTATASTITCRHWKVGCIQTNFSKTVAPASFVVDHLIIEPDPASEGVLVGVNKGSTVNVKSCSGSLPTRNGDKGKLIHWKDGATPANSDVTVCGVKVTEANNTDEILRPLVEAQMGKNVK